MYIQKQSLSKAHWTLDDAHEQKRYQLELRDQIDSPEI